MKLSTKTYLLTGLTSLIFTGAQFYLTKEVYWSIAISAVFLAFFSSYNYYHLKAVHEKTFATANVFCFKNAYDFRIAINRVINSKVSACIKLDKAQRKVLDTGAYNLFVTESGQKIIKELRLIFDLSVRASAGNVTLTAMQSVFAQTFNSDAVSKLIYFQNLPKESLDSLNQMLGITMH